MAWIVTAVGAAVGLSVAAPATVGIIGALGFTSAGVAAGSTAAGWMTPTTAVGSWFAVAQAVGATGSVAALGLLVPVAGAAVVGAAALGIWVLLPVP